MMTETLGMFRTGVKMTAWATTDRDGSDLRAIFSWETGEWSVATYGVGNETSVMVQPGSPVVDMSDIFRAAMAAQRLSA